MLAFRVVSFSVGLVFFFLMIRRPPRSTLDRSSAASDVYKRQAAGLSALLHSPAGVRALTGVVAASKASSGVRAAALASLSRVASQQGVPVLVPQFGQQDTVK